MKHVNAKNTSRSATPRPTRRNLFLPRASVARAPSPAPAFAPLTPVEPAFLLSIFLRGGADGLTLVAPSLDADYKAARTETQVWSPSDGDPTKDPAKVGLTLTTASGGTPAFCVPTALAPLKELFDEPTKRIAFLHACGSMDPTQSHFDQQFFVETATTKGLPAGSSGWIGRHLQTKTDHLVGNPSFRAIGFNSTLVSSLQGGPGATPIPEPASYTFPVHFPNPTQPQEALRSAALGELYEDFGVPLDGAMASVLDAIATLQGVNFAGYVPHATAVYPTTTFGGQLKKVAQLGKEVDQLEAVHVDLGGWDTHFAQGVHAPGGRMHDLMDDLARSVRAFHRDMLPSGRKFIVLVVTEFGRKVQENSSAGTDHGRGGVAIVCGSDVIGGVYTAWPGLAPAQLDGGDLMVTTDVRDVLGTVAEKALGNGTPSAVVLDDPSTSYTYAPLPFLP